MKLSSRLACSTKQVPGQPVLQKPSLKKLKKKKNRNFSKTKITEDLILFLCVLPEYMESDNPELELQMVVIYHLVFGIEPGCLQDFKS